ncbi:hypothetical protein Syun_015918 [Stephania yunnanensis]|uniref:CASP-like protein n=1 Tax=Stephania yunnanensis TaxID=152371 RepID=A0AAP0P4D5_9MAGN
MPSPHQGLRNGETPPRVPPHHHHHFHSTVAVQKLRRFNTLILVFRFAAFCFCLTSTIFMATNSRGSNYPSWRDFEAFRFVLAANAIVALYSLAEIGVSVWEIFRGTTVLPEIVQVWFDFGHDQAFAYLLLAADAAGTALARTLGGSDTCTDSNAFCVQADISVALGYAGFVFLGLSSLLSGFRVVCFMVLGSRFHI